MSVHTDDKEVKVCLKERESCILIGMKVFSTYTIPVMNVHTEDKEVQGVYDVV